MKKHLQWLLASIVILSLLLGACGQPAEAPAAEEPAAEEAVAEEPAEEEAVAEEAVAEEAEEVAEEESMEEEVVTIKWLMLNNWGVEGSGFLEEFYKEYPNIQVEMEATTINQLYEAIQVRVGGGAPDPDVFMVNGPMTASYAYRGLLMPLDEVFTEEEMANFYPATLEIGTYDGQFVSAPVHNSTQNLYYNADLFAAAGITPPAQDERWTWEQVTEVAQQLTTDEDGDGTPDVWGFNFEQIERFYQLQPLPLSIECCQSISDDGLSVDGIINGPNWVEAFTWYGSLYNELGVAPKGDVNTVDLFVAGKMAMFMGGPWNVNRLAATEDLGFAYGISLHPYFDGGVVVTPTSGWHLGVNANTEKAEAAKTFVHWFTTEVGAKAWFTHVRSALSGQQSVNEWIGTAEQYSEEPWNYIQVAIGELDSNPVVRPPVVGYLEYSQLIETAFADIRNGVDAQEALDLIALRIESELAKYAP